MTFFFHKFLAPIQLHKFSLREVSQLEKAHLFREKFGLKTKNQATSAQMQFFASASDETTFTPTDS